jgi:hypothetical protein
MTMQSDQRMARASGWRTLLLLLAITGLVGPLAACAAPEEEAEVPTTPGAPTGEATVVAAPVAKPSSGGNTLLTRLGPEASGINHQNYLAQEDQAQYLYVGAGVAAGDYDGDGLVDLYLVSEGSPNKLYRNLGNWQFEDVTAKAGVDVPRDVEVDRWKRRFPTGAYFFDYDNDADLDLFVTAFAGANTLFRNDGDGTFTDVTQDAGVGYVGASTTAAFSDTDRDGDVDVYVATYRPYGFAKSYFSPGTAPEPDLDYDIDRSRGTVELIPEKDLLYRNNGDGTFTESAVEAGLGDHRDWGLAAAFADANGDGWPDLYVANDFNTPDRFYLNNGDGTFHEQAPEAMRHTPWFSMGMDFGDVNNDGRLDLMTSDMLSPNRARRHTQAMGAMVNPAAMPPKDRAAQLMRNSLFINNGDGSFSDIAPFAGVAATDWTWTVKFADLDLDGFNDLLVTNGFVNDTMNADLQVAMNQLIGQAKFDELVQLKRTLPRLLTPNLAYRNNGGRRFEEVAHAWGFNDEAVCNGLALADLDQDGDQDVVTNCMNSPAGVYRNDATANRLKVVLQGRASNPHGLGARVTLEDAQGNTQVREVGVSGGYLSSHEPAAFFGLGEAATTIPRLTVDWPSGHRTELADVAANQVLTITEPEGQPAFPPPPTAQPTQFEDRAAALGVDFSHQVRDFNDFTAQPLLPFKMSRFGPGVAWGDLNGDGWEDLYVAGGNSQAGGLFQNESGQSFTALTAAEPPVGGREEQAPLWWPGASAATADLITSLSSIRTTRTNEQPIARRQSWNGSALQPTDWAALSRSSGSALAAADYNGDGQLDLFVGGRVRPRAYPLATASQLYRGGPDGLAPADADAPDLAETGLVSGAVWTDVENDGDPDLVLATDWGPVRLLQNDGGRLADATEAAGLAAQRGWWNGLAAGDVDHDGDMDLVATNIGLNTRYQASEEAPVVLLAGDLDGDGAPELVEAEWDGGKLYPARQGGELVTDLPQELMTRFASHQALAQATVENLLGSRLAEMRRFEVSWLAHTLFLNDGQGRFTAQALPVEAQLTAGYGVVLADLDNDGHDDIYLVGNFYGPEEMHTGQFDSGVSVWLRGDGKGGFTAVPVTESGLAVPYDAKGLAAADYDQDGWVDLAVGVNGGATQLFHNGGVAGRSGLLIRLVGDPGNPAAAGARITVTRADGLALTREIQAGSSFLSQNGAMSVFGLGEAGAPATVTVRWPDGTEQTVEGASPGQVLVLQKSGA